MRALLCHRVRRLSVVVSLTTLGTLCGCALWQTDVSTLSTDRSPLKQVAPQIDAIELVVYFVERPIGDPLMGNAMWADLDQVSTVAPDTLAALRRNGFRFGISGSDPPRSLQAALGITERSQSHFDDGSYRFTSYRYARRSGQELIINTWPTYPACQISIDEAGEPHSAQYERAQCVFRVTPKRLQDGWVRVDFIPEIHYGEHKLRVQASDQGWTQTPSRLVDPLFDQRFSVDLNLGELVVLSADGNNPESVGHHFFRGGTNNNKLQRLLIVKVADMKRLDPVYE